MPQVSAVYQVTVQFSITCTSAGNEGSSSGSGAVRSTGAGDDLDGGAGRRLRFGGRKRPGNRSEEEYQEEGETQRLIPQYYDSMAHSLRTPPFAVKPSFGRKLKQ